MEIDGDRRAKEKWLNPSPPPACPPCLSPHYLPLSFLGEGGWTFSEDTKGLLFPSLPNTAPVPGKLQPHSTAYRTSTSFYRHSSTTSILLCMNTEYTAVGLGVLRTLLCTHLAHNVPNLASSATSPSARMCPLEWRFAPFILLKPYVPLYAQEWGI